jgi:hypothetical protein
MTITKPIAGAVVSLAFMCLLASAAPACGAAHNVVSTDVSGHTITPRARVPRGPWQRTLSLKLVKTILSEFSLCAVWDKPPPRILDCSSPATAQLPANTGLLLEQSPVALAFRRDDSPGWGMLASSEKATLEAALSNTVSGDRPGSVRYRVTLRDASGKILVRSNVFTVRWHT